MFLISANHVEELEKVSQEKEKLNLDHEKTKSDLEQRLENMENQLSTANDNIKELETNLIVKQGGNYSNYLFFVKLTLGDQSFILLCLYEHFL